MKRDLWNNYRTGTESMKILVAHNVSSSRTGGMSRIMGYLHDEVERRGHEVEYFCTQDAPRSNGHPSLERFSFPLAILRHAEKRASEGRPFDVINVHEPSGAAVALRRARSGQPHIVVTSHGIEERGWRLRLTPEASGPERPKLKTRVVYPSTILLQANLALRKADHVFCLNSEDRDYLVSRFHRRESDITRIFPGADPIYGRRAAQRNYCRARTILFAASWLVRKGIKELVVAFEELAHRNRDLRLVVLNPGAEDSVVLSEFAEHLRGRVCCRRAQPDEGTAAALEDCDLFVLPSLYEGTPLTLMEAMWSGLPIVTTSVCGMKDVIQDGKNGLLIPPRRADALQAALQRLLDSQSLRAAIGQSAQTAARARYTWNEVAKPVIAAYERISLVRN